MGNYKPIHNVYTIQGITRAIPPRFKILYVNHNMTANSISAHETLAINGVTDYQVPTGYDFLVTGVIYYLDGTLAITTTIGGSNSVNSSTGDLLLTASISALDKIKEYAFEGLKVTKTYVFSDPGAINAIRTVFIYGYEVKE